VDSQIEKDCSAVHRTRSAAHRFLPRTTYLLALAKRALSIDRLPLLQSRFNTTTFLQSRNHQPPTNQKNPRRTSQVLHIGIQIKHPEAFHTTALEPPPLHLNCPVRAPSPFDFVIPFSHPQTVVRVWTFRPRGPRCPDSFNSIIEPAKGMGLSLGPASASPQAFATAPHGH
jgi:hypothetical protein